MSVMASEGSKLVCIGMSCCIRVELRIHFGVQFATGIQICET